MAEGVTGKSVFAGPQQPRERRNVPPTPSQRTDRVIGAGKDLQRRLSLMRAENARLLAEIEAMLGRKLTKKELQDMFGKLSPNVPGASKATPEL